MGGFGSESPRVSSAMAKKMSKAVEYVLFDVTYEDGSQRSNRKVPVSGLSGSELDAAARTFLTDQDRAIAEKSGIAPAAIKTVKRSGRK